MTQKLLITGVSLLVVAGTLTFLWNCENDRCLVFEWQKIRAVDSFERCEQLGFSVMESYPRQCRAGDKHFTEDISGGSLAVYFQERLVTLGIQAIGGLPIEGFDAELLMRAFPQLVEADFNGVQAGEGHYELKGGALVFIRDSNMPVSSAEQTVSNEGYVALLANLSVRLGIKADSRAGVDGIINRIKPFRLPPARAH